MSEMTLGSLFSGAGGFELAASRLGIKPVWASEIVPYAVSVTSARFPEMAHLGDITKMDGHDIPPVDIISGGSPCQDMSLSSPTRDDGVHGKRSGLFWEMIRVIKEMREATNGEYPRYVVFENVPGALSCHKGEDFRQIVEAFASICQRGVYVPRPERWHNAGVVVGNGWSLCWRVLAAEYFHLPQHRKRLYLVLDCRGERAHEILFEREGGEGLAWSDGENESGSSAPAERSTGKMCFAVDNHQQDHRLRLLPEGQPLTTLTHKMGTGGNNVPLVLCCGTKEAHQTLMSKQMGALTLWHDPQILYVDDGTGPILRRLTPLECLRAQGYPDDWWDGVPGSDTAKYRLMGNSVAIPVIEFIMKGIAHHA